MLALSLIKRVERLLWDGKLSQRKIAEQVGVSRGTVAAIATGRRGIHGRKLGEEIRDPRVHLAPPERCPQCGFLVYMPCLVCLTREHRHWQKVWQQFGTGTTAVVKGPPQRERRAGGRRHRNRTLRRTRVA